MSVIPLSNFLSDLPSLAIATDNVDADQVRKPRHWDIGFVRRFMVTFASLLLVAGATAQVFQTGWFVESLVTELAIVLVVRTRKAFWLSRPSALLSWPMLAIGLFAIAIPYLSGATWFGFAPLPVPVMAGLFAITLAYLGASEAL